MNLAPSSDYLGEEIMKMNAIVPDQIKMSC